MPNGGRDIVLEGLFAEGVLGIFRVIRGYADLRELAAVSVPYTMEAGDPEYRVVGHQRAALERHAEEIKQYLEQSENRFLPEVILSVRAPVNLVVARGEIGPDELGLGDSVYGVKSVDGGPVRISRRYSHATARMQQVRIRRRDLEQLRQEKVIRRIDGNHRLHLAAELADDPNAPSKYMAPFCMVLLGSPDELADDYAESLIFHTINSTALPLESEHGLSLLLGQDPAHAMTADNEFAYSPELHLTRLLAERLHGLPAPARERFGERPLTALWKSGCGLIDMDGSIVADRGALTAFADELFAALADIVTMLADEQPSLCGTYGFFEVAARVWRMAEGANHDERVGWTVRYLDGLGGWLGRRGITDLLDPQSPAELLLSTFEAARSHIPKRVFRARWYPPEDAPDGAYHRAELRLEQIGRALDDIRRRHDIELALVDMGTEQGATFPIHAKMYDAIKSSDIIVCDLTGHRPNVYVEAGYALSHGDHHRDQRVVLAADRGRVDQHRQAAPVGNAELDLLGAHRLGALQHRGHRQLGERDLAPVRAPVDEGLEQVLRGASRRAQALDDPSRLAVDRDRAAGRRVEDHHADRRGLDQRLEVGAGALLVAVGAGVGDGGGRLGGEHQQHRLVRDAERLPVGLLHQVEVADMDAPVVHRRAQKGAVRQELGREAGSRKPEHQQPPDGVDRNPRPAGDGLHAVPTS